MATILLAAAGAALGAGFGGTVLGLSGAVIGRAVGATIGKAIDQRLLGGGSEPVEVGRLDRLYLMGASEGAPIPRIWGKMRIPGQVIWASPYTETRQESGGGKGAPKPRTVSYSYSVSLAIALCEGPILGVGRVWADGAEIAATSIDMRVYLGDEDQLPDPAIAAHLPEGEAPAYRGTAYIVLENLALESFGNRVPQFSFEVMRQAQVEGENPPQTYQDIIRAVSIIPGTGEFTLSSQRVRKTGGIGEAEALNLHTIEEIPDFSVSMSQMQRELPNCNAASLVVSWFGDDLRCGNCEIRPKVSFDPATGSAFSAAWRSGGIDLAQVQRLPQLNGKSIYGGTPSDASVLEAIQDLKSRGLEVMFYPFILMEQVPSNGLADPYSDKSDQPAFPWRGRITLSQAPGRPGSSFGTANARTEVDQFFGSVQPSHFSIVGGQVVYSGPNDWGYRRFVLHNAYLCALAGGVESFCIGSELRGVTTIKAESNSFPAVEQLVQLAADVRQILGPGAKIGYGADWSEYFGFQDGENLFFHLDALWSHPAVDFIGIDNYMPLSDWREGYSHADIGAGSAYDLDYLRGNVSRGEGYDWFYDGPEGREAQRRLEITDGAYGEPWVYRYKDLAGWWSNPHHDRIAGARSITPTGWVPMSKPIRFTEFGCPAVDRGTNEPNKFIDPRSSESSAPYASAGTRDDYVQLQYFRATVQHWERVENNPVSPIFGKPMVDLDHCYAWTWDARPYPQFPKNSYAWGDGDNWVTGHWLTGRATIQPLDAVVREICEAAGVTAIETRRLHGAVHGFQISDVSSARAGLQSLSAVFGFDSFEIEGCLSFKTRSITPYATVATEDVALNPDGERSVLFTRLPESEMLGKVRLGFVEEGAGYAASVVEVSDRAATRKGVSQGEYSGLLPNGQAEEVAYRWMHEAISARDQLNLRLPPSRSDISVGTVISCHDAFYRVDRVEFGEDRQLEATRIDSKAYTTRKSSPAATSWVNSVASAPVTPFWLDIPSLDGSEAEVHQPRLAVASKPWPGAVAVWRGIEDADYTTLQLIERPSIVGLTQSALRKGRPGLLGKTGTVSVQLTTGSLSSVSKGALLSGRNLAALGDGSKDNWEVFQFQTATMVGPQLYELSGLLRGQGGTDGLMPVEWPEGSVFVLLDDTVGRVELASKLLNVARDYRIGALSKGPADPDARFSSIAFKGNGLRPYPICHLRTVSEGNGDILVTWVRRTRVNGDGWEGYEVPLGEDKEAYRLAILDGAGAEVRRVILYESQFRYTAAMQAEDVVSSQFRIEVVQLSATYGPGLVRSVTVQMWR